MCDPATPDLQLEKEIIIHEGQTHCRIKPSSQEVDAAWSLPSDPPQPTFPASPHPTLPPPPPSASYKAEMSLGASSRPGNGQIFILNNAHVRNE